MPLVPDVVLKPSSLPLDTDTFYPIRMLISRPPNSWRHSMSCTLMEQLREECILSGISDYGILLK